MLTGREARTLPPAVVRGLFWRIYAQSMASSVPDLVKAAHALTPPGTPVTALAAKGDAVKRLDSVLKGLFPEDDDGE